MGKNLIITLLVNVLMTGFGAGKWAWAKELQTIVPILGY